MLSPGSTCSPEHLVPGAAPVSSQRLQASAEHYGPVLNHPAEHRGTAQSAILGGLPLSAICAKPSSARAAVRPNPHRPPTPLRFPRVRSSEAFGRRPLSVSTALTGPASETLTDSGRSPRRWATGECTRVRRATAPPNAYNRPAAGKWDDLAAKKSLSGPARSSTVCAHSRPVARRAAGFSAIRPRNSSVSRYSIGQ